MGTFDTVVIKVDNEPDGEELFFQIKAWRREQKYFKPGDYVGATVDFPDIFTYSIITKEYEGILRILEGVIWDWFDDPEEAIAGEPLFDKWGNEIYLPELEAKWTQRGIDIDL